MRNLIASFIITFIFSSAIYSQSNVPAIIKLTTGETIEVSHFGQLNCSTNKFFDSYILIKGKYLDSPTEIKTYSDINKIVLNGYKAEPVASVGNEKGKIIVYKKDGVSVELVDAELVMSCYGSVEKYNQLRVQLINPLTGKAFEKAIPVKDIESVTFK